MQHLDAVAGAAHARSSSIASTSTSSAGLRADRHVARRAQQHEVAPLAARFLSRVMCSSSSSVGGPSKDAGRPFAASSSCTSLAHGRIQAQLALGEAQRDEQAERDRLAVPERGVAGRRLERVRERVAEVERRAHARVALVRGDDGELRARAVLDDRGERRQLRGDRALERREREHPLPQLARPRSAPSSRPRRTRRAAPRRAASRARPDR